MKRVFIKDGNIYVRKVAEDSAKPNENEKVLTAKIEKLERRIAELAEESTPENKERAELMSLLNRIKGKGNNLK